MKAFKNPTIEASNWLSPRNCDDARNWTPLVFSLSRIRQTPEWRALQETKQREFERERVLWREAHPVRVVKA